MSNPNPTTQDLWKHSHRPHGSGFPTAVLFLATFSYVLIHIETFPLLSLQELVDTQKEAIPHPQRYPGSQSQTSGPSLHCSPSSMQIRLQLYKLLRMRLLYSFFKQEQENHKLLCLLFPLFGFLGCFLVCFFFDVKRLTAVC